ncbi:MAG: hypothetical protein RIA38_03820 [Microcella pacifica]
MLLLAGLLAACAGGDPAVRPNHLVLNEALDLAPNASASWPLYLTRRGDYYAEVTLTPPAGQPRRAPGELRLGLAIADDDASLLERTRELALDAERPAATLAWFTSDREVPLKEAVTLRLDVLALADTTEPPQQLRVQVWRKLNRPLPR